MIKASLVLMLAYCVSKLLSRRSAAVRHLLWVGAISSAALLPLFGLLLPEWRLEIVDQITAVLPEMPRVNHIEDARGSANTLIHAYGVQQTSRMGFVLFAIWAGGSLVALSLLTAGSTALRRMASRSKPLSDPAWFKIAVELKRAFRFKRTIYLMEGVYDSMPLTCGIFRPRVFLPGSSAQWSEDRRFVVLAHELAHVRRCDWFVQILAEVACAIYWFHPLFWIARNQLYLESERACDDAVLRLGIEGQDYAAHLLHIARSLRKRSPACSVAMARQFNLEKRLVAILNSTADRRALTWKTVLAVIAAIMSVAIPLAAVRASAPEANRDLSTFTESNETLPHVVEYTTPPLYSDEARTRGIEGTVTVELRVGIDGRAKDLHVIRSLGFGLDENALLAVRDWRFVPAKRKGLQVETMTQVDVEFNLRNVELNEVIANDMATRVGPGVVPPQIIHRVEPKSAQQVPSQTSLEAVLLDAVIQEDGIPRVVRVLQSLGWEVDESAITALEQWRFSPAMKNGMPIKVRMSVEMTFNPAKT
jgi:TonB family protein